MKENLKQLIVRRDYWQDVARISQKALQSLSKNCLNLEHLQIQYTREFESIEGLKSL
jgi:hypothetical protein